MRSRARAPLAWSLAAATLAVAPAAHAQNDPPPQAVEQDDITHPVDNFELRLRYEDGATRTRSDRVQQILRNNGKIKLTSRWQLGYRLDLPLTASDTTTADNPNGNYGYGVGRPLAALSLAEAVDERWAYGFGGQIKAPAISGAQFGNGNWDVRPLLGARVMLPEISDGSFFLPLFRYADTFAQARAGKPVSNLQFSPQLKIALPDTWFVELFPSPDIRWNFGAASTGQTGRLFLPFDAETGRSFGNLLTSLEVSVPVVKDYPVYNLKIEARLCWPL